MEHIDDDLTNEHETIYTPLKNPIEVTSSI